MMTKDVKRVRHTLRIDQKLSDRIDQHAASLGLTRNAYISMILHKELAKEATNGVRG